MKLLLALAAFAILAIAAYHHRHEPERLPNVEPDESDWGGWSIFDPPKDPFCRWGQYDPARTPRWQGCERADGHEGLHDYEKVAA